MSQTPVAGAVVRRRRGGPRVVLALLAALLLAAGLTGPAQAERYIHHDASRDVQKLRILAPGDDGFVPARNARQGDYVKLKVWHQVKSVRVVGKFRRLDRTGFGLGQLVVIRTPDHLYGYQVVAGPGMWKGAELDLQDLGEGDDPDSPGAGTDAPCITGHRVNYERNRFSMKISRACLGRPAWVRVGAMFIAFNRDSVGFDDPLTRGIKLSNQPFRLTPKLVHGAPR